MSLFSVARRLYFPPKVYMNVRFKTQITEEASCVERKKGLLVGVYTEGFRNVKDFILTSTAEKFNIRMCGKLMEELHKSHGQHIINDGVHLFRDLDPEFLSVALVNLGKKFSPSKHMNGDVDKEDWEERVRVAAGIGTRALCKEGIGHILMDGLGNAQYAAEGASMAVWRFMQRQEGIIPKPSLELCLDEDESAWMRGVCLAEAQTSTLQMINFLCVGNNSFGQSLRKKKE